jgi:micrococcal nuclease
MGAICCVDKETEILRAATIENTPKPIYGFQRAKVLSVYDGDTITIAAVDHGVKKQFSLRLFGVDCPEIRTKDEKEKEAGIAAREFVKDLVLDKIVSVEILNNRIVEGKKVREKFGRLIGRVRIGSVDLAGEMIRLGHAVKYDGGKKVPFCDW